MRMVFELFVQKMGTECDNFGLKMGMFCLVV